MNNSDKWLIDSDGNAYNLQGTIIAPFYEHEHGGLIVYIWFAQIDLYDNLTPVNSPLATLDEARAFIRGYAQGYNDRNDNDAI